MYQGSIGEYAQKNPYKIQDSGMPNVGANNIAGDHVIYWNLKLDGFNVVAFIGSR